MTTLAPARRKSKSSPPEPVGPMTYEQYLSDPNVETHSEWVDGEVIRTPPVADGHANVGRFLFILLGFYVDLKQSGTIRAEPFQMRARPDLPGRAPDIMFIARSRLKRIRRMFLDGPADLVVEIVSPESQTRDRVHKFAEYEAGGVREYWLVDPDRRTADFYVRGRNGKYRATPVGPNGVYHSKVLVGLWLKVDWLWQLPSTPDVLKAWGVI